MGRGDTETSRLLMRWQAGDREALGVLLERNLPAIRAQVHVRLGGFLRRVGDTGDFVHDAVVQLLEYAPRFVVSEERLFRALVVRMVENTMRDGYDHYTARRREIARERPLPSDTVLHLDPPAREVETPSEAAQRREREAWVRLGLELLDPKDRAAIVLRRWDKFSYKEIGKRLGITEDAARTRYHRAYVRLSSKVAALRRGQIEKAIGEAAPESDATP